MKFISMVLAGVFYFSVAQADFLTGKYEVTIPSNSSGTKQTIVFKIDSNGTSTIEGDEIDHMINPLTVNLLSVFNSLTIVLYTWGDEDYSSYTIGIKKIEDGSLVVNKSCGAFIDNANSFIETLNHKKIIISKWSKQQNNFIKLPIVMNDEVLKRCNASYTIMEDQD